MVTVDECIHKYNLNMMKLINKIERKNRNDYNIARLKTRLVLAKDTDPTVLIKYSGPYVYKYREQICNNQVDFFLETDLEEYKNIPDEFSFCHEIISKIKEEYKKLTDKEKEEIYENVCEMLEAYCDYQLVNQ